jgi:hypothetical protein
MAKPPNQKRKLIVLKHRNGGSQYAVTQRDLEELLYLERQMKDAAALWRIKRNTIRRYIELGCEVEPGLREVHFDVLVHDADSEHPRSSSKLIVR